MRVFGLEGSAMKQGAHMHPKFKSLAKTLNLRQYEAVGILESIWMMACQFAGEDGDLSRFKHQEIADWVDWRGDSEELIRVLVDCRWLDLIDGSLRIHDWLEHRPYYLKDRSRKRQTPTRFDDVSGCSTRLQEIPGSSRKPPGDYNPSLVQSIIVQSSPVKSMHNSKETAKGFSPPSVQEVQEYAKTRCLTIDAERFVDFYQSKGWMVGKSKMKDWQATLRNWARTQREQTGKTLSPESKKGIAYVN
jgi:hypothetical protein